MKRQEGRSSWVGGRGEGGKWGLMIPEELTLYHMRADRSNNQTNTLVATVWKRAYSGLLYDTMSWTWFSYIVVIH